MNLTIIYGNGFDKNLGLNTTYPDFYKWLSENKKRDDDEIFCNIKEKPDNWSDLELALGQYTFDNEIHPEKFEESYGNLIEDLNEYLLLEQEKSVDSMHGGDMLLNTIEHLETNLISTGQKRNAKYIQNLIDDSAQISPLYIQFITFNYTKTMESLLRNNWYSRTLPNTNYMELSINQPIHVHGTLNNSMVLGVNDETQFKSEIFDNNFPEFFVKNKNLTDHVNSTDLDDALEVINYSQVIFLFGVSLGETDKIYWETIATWLLYNKERIVLLYDYETPIDSISKVVQSKMEKSWNNTKDKFLRQSGLGIDEQKRISKQIFPLYGNGFFNLEEAQQDN
ncbi:AbiH family protein [Lactococcus garvieae]|uniref:AbiH family protein n=1 Tax=Lactococcus garvieae TaxID=1363 RepID=UPI003852F0A3